MEESGSENESVREDRRGSKISVEVVVACIGLIGMVIAAIIGLIGVLGAQ
jgi:hypothetical protein